MSFVSRIAAVGAGIVLSLGVAAARADVAIKDISLDKPLLLDENTNYTLKNVHVSGINDGAALTISGRIQSIAISNSSFGRCLTGPDGKASGMECAGAVVGRLLAVNTTFFDAENQLASLRDGTFGKVTFERCRFTTSESFLKQVYAANPWRNWPPMTEFYNIDRLELLDNDFSNTLVVIHPSVKQVIVRGTMPSLQVMDPNSTHVILLEPGQKTDSVAPVVAKSVAAAAKN